MTKSQDGYQYILSMEDGFSRFISLAPLKSKHSEEVIQALLERYISRFGCPLVIHSDNGKEFTNQLLAKLLAQLEVAQIFTLPTILSQIMWKGFNAL